MDRVNEQYEIALENLNKMKEFSMNKLNELGVIDDNLTEVNEAIKKKNEICETLVKEATEIETEVNFNRTALKLYKDKAAKLEAEINQQDKEIETAKKNISKTYSKFIEETEGKYPVLERLDKIYEVLSKKSFENAATKSTEPEPGISDDPNKSFDKDELSGSETSTTATKYSGENDLEDTNNCAKIDSDEKISRDPCLDGNNESHIVVEISDDKLPLKSYDLNQDQEKQVGGKKVQQRLEMNEFLFSC